jgi:hypothetical protein
MDDQAYFSVRVLSPRKVLLVSDTEAEIDLWQVMLESLEQGKRAAFETAFVATGKLNSINLEDFDLVCLINAGRPEAAAWEKLRSFVEAGGGLFVALGARNTPGQAGGIDPLAYDVPVAKEILPAQLKAVLRLPPGTTIDFRSSAHPLLQRIDEIHEAISTLASADIRRYWDVEPTAEATVIAPYAVDAQPPAILERTVGRGRVLLFTTAVNSVAWNDLTDSWAFLVLVDQSINYLSTSTAGRANWTVGSPILLRIDPEAYDRNCVLRMPDFKQLPREIPRSADDVSFRDLTAPGHYELVSADDSTDFAAGFSLNLPAEESDLAKLTKTELDDLFGPQRYAISQDVEGLARNVTAGRLGQEVYGVVLAVLLAVFVLEQITGAWFYRTDEPPPQSIRPAAIAKT